MRRAAGNPLFLEQLLRHAEEGADVAVPGSVRSLVQARLDRLEPADKAALQAASVLGQRFDAAVLAHTLERPGYVPDGLVAHVLVRRQADGSYLFAHALIRDAVYDSLLRSRRRELHRRAAGWFEARDPVLHAEHLDRAEDPGAAGAYLVAARAQSAGYRYEAALRLVRRGLDACDRTQADRFALALFEGDILHDLGVMPEALVAYKRALGVAADDAERCRAWIGLAAVKRVTDDLDGAFADLERAQAAAAAQGLLAEAARVHYLRGNLCFPARRHRRLPARARPGPRSRAPGPSARAGGRGAGRAGRRRICAWPDDQRPRPAERVRRALPPARLRPDRGRERGPDRPHDGLLPAARARLWSERWRQRRPRPGWAISGRS